MRFLLRLILNAAAVFLAANLVPGITLSGPGAAIVAGIILGFVNAICLALVAWLVPGFSVHGFGAAFVGALVVSIVSWLLSALLVDRR